MHLLRSVLPCLLLVAVACLPASPGPAGPGPTVVPPPTVAPVEAAPTVETCPPGQTPAFAHGFAMLKAQLGSRMGEPLSCERHGPDGDALQQTSAGLARYRRETNIASFTRGADHWALTERGLVHWTGRALDPPEDARLVEGPELAPAREAAAAAPLPTTAALRLRFAPGETRTYTSTTRIDYASSLLRAGQSIPPLLLDLTFRYRTLEVHPDGSATILASFEEALAWSNRDSAEVPGLKGLGVRMRVAPDGSFTATSVEQGGTPVPGVDPHRLAEQMILFRYPAEPLSIGESFERQVTLSGGPTVPEMVLHSRYVFAGLASLSGRGAVRLEETARMPIGTWPSQQGIQISAGEADYRGSHYVSLQDGWPISGNGVMNMSFSATLPNQTSGSFSARMEVRYQLR